MECRAPVPLWEIAWKRETFCLSDSLYLSLSCLLSLYPPMSFILTFYFFSFYHPFMVCSVQDDLLPMSGNRQRQKLWLKWNNRCYLCLCAILGALQHFHSRPSAPLHGDTTYTIYSVTLPFPNAYYHFKWHHPACVYRHLTYSVYLKVHGEHRNGIDMKTQHGIYKICYCWTIITKWNPCSD